MANITRPVTGTALESDLYNTGFKNGVTPLDEDNLNLLLEIIDKKSDIVQRNVEKLKGLPADGPNAETIAGAKKYAETFATSVGYELKGGVSDDYNTLQKLYTYITEFIENILDGDPIICIDGGGAQDVINGNIIIEDDD